MVKVRSLRRQIKPSQHFQNQDRPVAIPINHTRGMWPGNRNRMDSELIVGRYIKGSQQGLLLHMSRRRAVGLINHILRRDVVSDGGPKVDH